MTINDNQISKYDRIRGELVGVALFTKPSTIKHVQPLTGESQTFIVETARLEDKGDTIFVECMDSSGLVRIALPAKVADAISRQRDSLTSKTRSKAAQARAEADKKNGIVPGFMRRKRGAR